MNAHDLTVSSTRDGPVCVLTVAGELDATTAAQVTEEMARAVDSRAERFVWDLSGLAFLDCAGAYALGEATRTVPPGCPVIVRPVSRPARHVFGLLGLDLECLPHDAGVPLRNPAGPWQEPGAAWSRWQHMVLEIARVAAAVAETEEKVAATMRWLAQHRQPADAARLTVLSEHARRSAVRSRRWVQSYVPHAPVSHPGRSSAGW